MSVSVKCRKISNDKDKKVNGCDVTGIHEITEIKCVI